jgi:hypothetical protein
VNKHLRAVLGEAAGTDMPPEATSNVQPAEDAFQPGQPSETVEMLASAWESGAEMDVVNQLLYTPISYTDMVALFLRLGPESIRLGTLLDELKEAGPQGTAATETDPVNRVLGQPTP